MIDYQKLLLDKAQQLYNRATRTENSDEKSLLEATELYRKVLKKSPSNSFALEHLGITLATLAEATKNKTKKKKWYQDALMPINKVIHTKSKHSIHAKRIKWHILDALGEQSKEYYQYLDLVLKEEPKNATALRVKADWLMDKNKYRIALKFLEMLLQTHACNEVQHCLPKKDVLSYIGLCWLGLKKPLKAVKYFDSVLKIQHDFNILHNKTLALYAAKKYPETLKVARMTLKFKISREQRINLLRVSFDCLLHLNKRHEATKLLKILIKLDKGNKIHYDKLLKRTILLL